MKDCVYPIGEAFVVGFFHLRLGGSPAQPAPIRSGLCVQGRWWLRPGQGHQAWRLMASSSGQLVLAHVTAGSGKITRAELLSVKRVV